MKNNSFSFIPILVLLSFTQVIFAQLPSSDEIIRITKQTEKIRKLKPKSEIEYEFLDSLEVHNYVKNELEKAFPKGTFENKVKTLTKFGFLPKNYDLKKSLSGLLSEQVAAFFEPDSEKIFFSEKWTQKDEVIAHEYVHKLQNDNFNLKAILQKAQTFSEDETMALQGLVEGDATLSMLFFQLNDLENLPKMNFTAMLPFLQLAMEKDFPEISTSPDYVKSGFIFPYVQGMDFVNYFYSKGGFSEVDKIFKNLPVSTEQILHPEKYPNEKPQKIDFQSENFLPEGFSKLDENTLGEFNIGILVGEKNAEGWNGDKYFSFEKDGKIVIVWLTFWDTKNDAFEFRNGILQNLEQKLNEPTLVESENQVVGFDSEKSFLIFSEGEKVFVVDGYSESENKKILKLLKK